MLKEKVWMMEISTVCVKHFTGWFRPFVWWREVFGRFYPDGGVPFPRRKHYHLVQELVNPGQQVLSVLGFVRNVMKDLDRELAKILK